MRAITIAHAHDNLVDGSTEHASQPRSLVGALLQEKRGKTDRSWT